MQATLPVILTTTLYFLALINPVSKVSVLAVLSSESERHDFAHLTTKSSLVAAGILLLSMVFGELVLRRVFHVELYSLRLAGGTVLCWVGFNALRKGVFFEHDTQARYQDFALVPLACPMIAGPATIAAAIATNAQEGLAGPAAALLLALALNHLIMRLSRFIGLALGRFNLLGALVRLTGLAVMTIGTQMVLDGIEAWQAHLP
ncbi:MAG: MarC family protein [Lentisphaerae bacterium]|nr:MarC family protein [Lentisphaerota bacterium]